MRLTWNEIRARAALFADDWQHARYEKGETQSFYNAFFTVFGINRRRVAQYEMSVARTGRAKGFVDLFWPRTLIVEQKSKGRDLFQAEQQALDYLSDIAEHEQPRFILVSDFQTFKLTDLDTRESTAFALADLPKHIEKFGFMIGVTKRAFRDQDPVNIKAAELVGLLHDAIKASGYTGHKLEVFLTRIVFCLFADDTGIFQPKDILVDYLEARTSPDGADMGPLIAQLFDVLNTPEVNRSPHLDEDLAQFPYVNGHLFAEYFPAPVFNADMRAALLNACRFDWTPISPAIFGALFQSVMDPQARRAIGAHYTTEKNILKTIEPLVLDDLRAELAHLTTLKRDKRRRLEAFQKKLSGLTFFDPACGCGNFLIIAYRELRALEIEAMRALKDIGEMPLLVSYIDVNQFYGIEIEEFPAKIAETALWMMDHVMNNRLSLEFGEVYTRIPLQAAPTIVHGDALNIDWAEVLPPEKCSFVLGNPPFIGQSYQTKEQREALRLIARPEAKSAGPLDFVTGWFLKAAAYVASLKPSKMAPRIAFVATNSITQGEQVALLWPKLFEYGLEIAFAHRTFEWGSEARGKAHVHVVIIGLDRVEAKRPEARLFSYADIKGEPTETRHAYLSPYLFDASALADPHLVVVDAAKPISHRPKMELGVKMVDNGHYTFSPEEKEAFLAIEPKAQSLMYNYIGGKEYINGTSRYCLAFKNANLPELRQMPKVMERIKFVRDYRAASKKAGTRNLADFPMEYECGTVPDSEFLVVPNVSSERRAYIPIGWLEPPTIPNQKLRVVIEGASLGLFALLTSNMHMAWMRAITGRMKSDYMYSVGVVYNTFPLPEGDLSGLGPLAEAVLEARAAHPEATLADLYDPDLMPPNLRRAHKALDRAVDKLYRKEGFASDRDRVEHLFARYEALVKPLLAKAADKPKRRRRKS